MRHQGTAKSTQKEARGTWCAPREVLEGPQVEPERSQRRPGGVSKATQKDLKGPHPEQNEK